jgi:hypothetical protein
MIMDMVLGTAGASEKERQQPAAHAWRTDLASAQEVPF